MFMISCRGALKGRLTRLAVVLIQRTAPVAGEDPSAADKANALCTACELNPKCLFVLPLGDHLQGYILRYIFLCALSHDIKKNIIMYLV